MLLEYYVLAAYMVAVRAFCPQVCNCTEDPPEVRCLGVGLNVVPTLLNPALRTLNLGHNHLTSITAELLFYESLESLDFSYNKLSVLGPETFEAQTVLKELRLAHNNISSLDETSLAGLKDLHTLDLSHNVLVDLPPDALSHTPSLKVLILSHNRLHSLASHTFRGLTHLGKLDLCDNYFRQLPAGAMTELTALETLEVCRNRLTYLLEGDLPVRRLKSLSLDGNSISTIDPAAFHRLESLKVLSLSNNLLGTVPTSALSALVSLESLILSRNNISSISAGAFVGLRRLTALEISRCPLLSTLSSSALIHCGQLQTLTLSHNPMIHHIPSEFLKPLQELQYLDLRGNSLETLDGTSLAWGNLQSLDVRDNTLVCNCSLRWLATLLSQPNSTVPDVQCSMPENLRGVHLSRLSPSQLLCVARVQVVVAAAVVTSSSLLLIALAVVLCRYRRRLHRDKLSGLGWSPSPLAPWHQDDDPSGTVSTRHIMADEYLYQTYNSIPKNDKTYITIPKCGGTIAEV